MAVPAALLACLANTLAVLVLPRASTALLVSMLVIILAFHVVLALRVLFRLMVFLAVLPVVMLVKRLIVLASVMVVQSKPTVRPMLRIVCLVRPIPMP